MLRRFTVARTSLAALSAVKLANFRDERLEAKIFEWQRYRYNPFDR